ncbi:hypothetical protein PVL30_004835 [Lodderomyces elongisporus]|uniref:uncharacterized protein n=1 Tax=Lodderomyces elongisporus TaxID=36914 RepID=UPI002923F8C0|nr:uncharacterized protein PVL30_004835 [Lodderomyces elongisporus]WLF81041.1 hypothetical protein PVL30_004835 [Lodderomyces elongisporus]
MGKSTNDSINDLHPVELAAHSLLSGPLDSLNDNFESLSQSQVILLTRLKIIEDRLNNFKELVDANIIDEKQFLQQTSKVKELSKRLSHILRQLDKIDSRLDKLK